MPNYTTGEMAKFCNVSVRTVQFYDTRGVLHPSGLTEGGRRIYNDDDLRKLRLVCTLKALGLSLNSIQSVLRSELSAKILEILLAEQVTLLTGEVDERRKQLDMIRIVQDSIRGKTIIPANTILGIEDMMEKKNKVRNHKKLVIIYIGVGAAAASQLWLLAWLITSGRLWPIAVYLPVAVTGILITVFQLKDSAFICPKCGSAFKPSLWRAFFSTGDHKVRWMACPECGHKDWCVIRKQAG